MSSPSKAFALVLRGVAEAMLKAAHAIDPHPEQPAVTPDVERAANRAYWVIVLRREPRAFDELPVEYQYLAHEAFRAKYPPS